jgi:rhodanese-related sulfurtransferase
MLRSLFGLQPKVDLGQLLKDGASIIDVRTPGEYAEGHVKGSINIPLDRLEQQLTKIPGGKPVITVCRSGMRSGQAVQVLKAQGFDVHNGGPWTSVNALVSR